MNGVPSFKWWTWKQKQENNTAGTTTTNSVNVDDEKEGDTITNGIQENDPNNQKKAINNIITGEKIDVKEEKENVNTYFAFLCMFPPPVVAK